MILLLYVDDLFLIGEDKPINECKKKLVAEFEMKDLVMMHYFLGLEVWKYPDEIFLNQGKYAIEILKIFGMIDCKAMTTLMTTSLKECSPKVPGQWDAGSGRRTFETCGVHPPNFREIQQGRRDTIVIKILKILKI